MRKRKISKTQWLTWEGDDFPRAFHSDSLIFYVHGHYDLDSNQEMCKELAVAIQREGICSSLGECFSLINLANVSHAGYSVEDPENELPTYHDLEDDAYEWDATYVEVPYVG